MADKLIAVPESQLTDIADAIRTKRDITTPIKVDDMAMQIGLIDGGLEIIAELYFEIPEDNWSSSQKVYLNYTYPSVLDEYMIMYTDTVLVKIELVENKSDDPQHIHFLQRVGVVTRRSTTLYQLAYAYCYNSDGSFNTGGVYFNAFSKTNHLIQIATLLNTARGTYKATFYKLGI